jgi:tetratricopeptide (TPR) repeat protein
MTSDLMWFMVFLNSLNRLMLKMILNAVLLFLIGIQAASAQIVDLDSLLVEINKPQLEKTKKVDLLNLLSAQYTAKDISKNDSVLKEAINLSKSTGYNEGLIDALNNYGAYFYQTGKYEEALKFSLQSKSIQDSLDTNYGQIRTINNLGRIYDLMNEPEKAIENYDLSLKLLKTENPNHPQLPATHFYLGSALEQLTNYDEAAFHYKAAKSIAKREGYKVGIAIAEGSLGRVYTKSKRFKDAIRSLNNALDYFTETNQKTNQAHTYLNLAEVYAGLKDFKKAIDYNNKALEIYEAQGTNFRQLRYVYSNQSEYYSNIQDYKRSSEYLKKLYEVKDSVFSEEQMKTIEDLRTKYDTEKAINLKEIAEQEAKIAKTEAKQNQLYFTASSVVLLLLLFTFLTYFKQQQTKRKKELIASELKAAQKQLALEKQYRNSELKALKSQMNPHFVFNALNSIQDYILSNERNLASDYLGKFSDLVRRYLKFSDELSITLSDEIASLKLYLELEQLRFEDYLQTDIIVDEVLDMDNTKIPTMLVQPYVENAIKHGLLHKKGTCILTVQFLNFDKNFVQCIIEDNGIGRKKANEIKAKQLRFHKSFALKANQSRLELLNYKSKHKIGVQIEDLGDAEDPKGTRVTINIPIQ